MNRLCAIFILSFLVSLPTAYGSARSGAHILNSAVSYAQQHPWWTAYLSFGAIVGSTLAVTSYVNNHDLAEYEKLKTFLNQKEHPKKIECSLYSSAVWSVNLRSAISEYNKRPSAENYGKVNMKLYEATQALKTRQDGSKNIYTDAVFPYLTLGVIGAAISWFWKK